MSTTVHWVLWVLLMSRHPGNSQPILRCSDLSLASLLSSSLCFSPPYTSHSHHTDILGVWICYAISCLHSLECPSFPLLAWLTFLGGGIYHRACGILVSWPGIQPGTWTVEAQSPNHWTTREFPLPGWLSMHQDILFVWQSLGPSTSLQMTQFCFFFQEEKELSNAAE